MEIVVKRSDSSTKSGVIAAAVVIPTVLVIIIVTLVVAVLAWFRLHTKVKEEFTIDKMIKAYKVPCNHPLFDRIKPLQQAGPHEKEFSSGNISFCRELGEGAFGCVYQGMATNIIAGENSTVVAVKQLKLDTTSDDTAAVVDFFKG